MDFAKLSSNEKLAAAASAVVLILGIVSLVNDWGALIVLPVLAAVAMLAIVFLPQLSPTTQLPAGKGLLMLAAGGAAAVFWVISALSWLDWIAGHLATFDTLQYLVGLVASLVMAWTGWVEFQAQSGTVSMASATPAATPPAPSAPPPATSAPPPATSAPPPAAHDTDRAADGPPNDAERREPPG